MDEKGKVKFDVLKYDSTILFENLPLFDEAPVNFFFDDTDKPWLKLAKAIVSPFSNFRYHLEIAKRNMSKNE